MSNPNFNSIAPMDLASHVKGYSYNQLAFSKLENRLFEKMRAYDEKYGAYLTEHLKRTSDQLFLVLVTHGLSQTDSEKLKQAFLLHDVGKILQPIALWEVTSGKPSDEKKKERSNHVRLAQRVIDDTINELGLDLSDDDKEHLKTIHYFAKTHHERLCGKGPLGWKGGQLDKVLRIATIIDEIDGKHKVNAHKGLGHIIDVLKSDKHSGQFDHECISLYADVFVKGHTPSAKTGKAGFARLAL